MKRSFDVFFDLRMNQQLSKQGKRRWFEAPLRSLWRHYNENQRQTSIQGWKYLQHSYPNRRPKSWIWKRDMQGVRWFQSLSVISKFIYCILPIHYNFMSCLILWCCVMFNGVTAVLDCMYFPVVLLFWTRFGKVGNKSVILVGVLKVSHFPEEIWPCHDRNHK